jgi:Ca2+-binding EF-hand superfamily protein
MTPSASNIIIFSVLLVVTLFILYFVLRKAYQLLFSDQDEKMLLLIEEAFETFDEDGSGALDPAEIQGAIDELEELDDIEGKEDLQKSLEALKGVDEIKLNDFQEVFVCKSILELISRIALFSECLEKMKARQKQLRIETEMEAAQVRYTENLAKYAFEIFDEDGSGTISPQELKEVQEKLQMRGEEVSHLCFDHEDITFDEFFNSISGDDHVVTRQRLHQVADAGDQLLYDRRLKARILAEQDFKQADSALANTDVNSAEYEQKRHFLTPSRDS